jgi:CheY-like chemotaxis protein
MAKRSSSIPTASSKLLIVDDDAIQLRSLARAVGSARRDISVVGALGAREAIALLSKDPIDVVLSDLRMPEMDGFELLAWLRRRFPHLPVIVMTAFGAETVSRLDGSPEVLEKPFDVGELKRKVADLMRQSVKGRVENISLASFLQLLELERKTCTLTVTSVDRNGRLFFRGGRLVGAETDGLDGADAALEIVTWEHADVEISDVCTVKGPEVEGGLRYLLLEGMHLKDERERHAPRPLGIAQETDAAIDSLLSSNAGAVREPEDPWATETMREALEQGRTLEGSLATLLVETATGNLIAAAIGAKGVDVEVAAAATAELARQKPRVEERIGLKDTFSEVLLTSTRRYYLLRPVGSDGRMFLLLVLDRKKANLTTAQEGLAAIERELTEKSRV